MRSKQTAFFYKDGTEGAQPSYGNIDCGFTRHLNNKVLVTNHGLRTPRESFFQKLETFWIGQTDWTEIL